MYRSPRGANLETAWPSAREKLISIGHEKATKEPTEQGVALGQRSLCSFQICH